MRDSWLPLLLLVAPVAVAQEAPELLRIEIEPFAGLVKPLQGAISTTVRVEVSCALLGPEGIVLEYAPVQQPRWSSVLVSPASDVVGREECMAQTARREATLTATATDQAPYGAPEAVVVEVRAGSGPRERTARAEAALAADYFSILDAQLAEPTLQLAPGGTTEARFRITNLGNGAARLVFALEKAPERLDLALPAPVVLESKQAGGTRISEEITFVVSAPREAGFVNRVETFTLSVAASSTGEPAAEGDGTRLSWIVHVRSGLAQAAERTEAPGLAAAPLLALTAALVLRRR